jgi:hypothetical protein
LAARESNGNLQSHFDIRKKEADGTIRSIESVSELHVAAARIVELLEAAPGEYFVFDLRTQTKISAGPA